MQICRHIEARTVSADLRDAARSDALVMLNRQRIKAGLDNTIALNQNQSAAAAARQQVQAAQQQIDALRNALAALAGAGPDRP